MKFLYQHRGTGKTTFLIRQSVKTGYPIAVANKRQAEHIKITAAAILGKDKAKELPEPIVATPQNCQKAGRYYIDEAGTVLKQILGGNPLLATMSDDDDKGAWSDFTFDYAFAVQGQEGAKNHPSDYADALVWIAKKMMEEQQE